MSKELRKKPNPSKLLFTALRPTASRPPASSGALVGSARLRHYQQNRENLRAYQEICGFRQRDTVPATWLHVQSFPLQTHMMSSKDWPFPALGTVHVSNSIKMLREVNVDEPLDISVRASHTEPHAKGTLFYLLGHIRAGGELVWTSTSTYLSPGYRTPGQPTTTERLELPEADPTATWDLPADLGRRYAKASGDFNPIHLHSLTAKAFGFKSAIVHGMWTHARALAEIEDTLPTTYEAKVQFTKPITLPSTVSFAHHGDRHAVLGEDGKPRIIGSVREFQPDVFGSAVRMNEGG